MSVDEALVWLGLSRSSAYQAVRAGEIPSFRLGGKIRIPVAGLRRMLQLDTDADQPA